MKIEFLSPDSQKWRNFLDSTQHDLYYLPEYVALEADRMSGKPVAVFATDGESKMLLPLIIRKIDHYSKKMGSDAIFDGVSPYGYSGPLILAPVGKLDSFVEEVLITLQKILIKERIISVFARLHPFLDYPECLSSMGTLIKHGDVVYVDLFQSEEEIFNGMRNNHRRDIKKLLQMSEELDIEVGWKNLDSFVSLYYETMERRKAPNWYYFTFEYFTALKCKLSAYVTLWVLKKGGQVKCGALFSQCFGIAHYILGASISGSKIPYSKLLLYKFIQHARCEGNRIFNLGGGVGSSIDSLFLFKSGFSRSTKPFHTWRWVVNQNVYDLLVKEWELRTGSEADDITGYFPAYRKNID